MLRSVLIINKPFKGMPFLAGFPSTAIHYNSVPSVLRKPATEVSVGWIQDVWSISCKYNLSQTKSSIVISSDIGPPLGLNPIHGQPRKWHMFWERNHLSIEVQCGHHTSGLAAFLSVLTTTTLSICQLQKVGQSVVLFPVMSWVHNGGVDDALIYRTCWIHNLCRSIQTYKNQMWYWSLCWPIELHIRSM